MSKDLNETDIQSKFDCAYRYAEEGNYSAALGAYLELAELGYSDCQAFVGGLYYSGKGVDRDIGKARYWLEKASEGNESRAQFLLGKISAEEGNYSEAFKWYEKAGSKKYAPAIYKMAIYFEKGRVGDVDKPHALKLYREAAKQGHLYAKRTLAFRLLKGWGGLAGVLEGVGWFYRMIIDGYKIGKEGDLESDSVRI